MLIVSTNVNTTVNILKLLKPIFMVPLPNGCRRSEFTAFPSNWKSSKAKLSDIWYAQCRFTDPAHLQKFPKGKPVRIKGGVNRIKTLEERRLLLAKLIREMEVAFDNGYNPITQPSLNEKSIKTTVSDANQGEYEIPLKSVNPSSQFISAFRFALEQSQNVKETKMDIKSGIKSLETAAVTLGFSSMAIGDIQVKHIKMLLDECHRSRENFSAKRFNKVKAHLSGLFKYLIEMGAAYGNMALAVSPMREKASKLIYLQDHEVKLIKDHLWVNNRPFFKFMMIFYYSGGRVTELFRLQGRDVDLVEQTYSTLVLKGKERWVKRTIRNVALPYWNEQMQNCGPNDYVFSKDLLPGSLQICSKQVSRRWMHWVKKPLNIQATFYKLKHRNADKTLSALGAKMAAGQAGHTSTRMMEQVYAYNEEKRIHEGLKGLDIEL